MNKHTFMQTKALEKIITENVLIDHDAIVYVSNFMSNLEDLIYEHAENIVHDSEKQIVEGKPIKLIEKKHVQAVIEKYISLKFAEDKEI